MLTHCNKQAVTDLHIFSFLLYHCVAQTTRGVSVSKLCNLTVQLLTCLVIFSLRWAEVGRGPPLLLGPAAMARYLRHFTAVGDHHPGQWEEEELHVASEELSPATGQFPATLTFRDSLKKLYSSDHFQVWAVSTSCTSGSMLCQKVMLNSCWCCFQVLVVCLVILDAIFVLAELLIDLAIIKLEHGHIAPEVSSGRVHSLKSK